MKDYIEVRVLIQTGNGGHEFLMAEKCNELTGILIAFAEENGYLMSGSVRPVDADKVAASSNKGAMEAENG